MTPGELLVSGGSILPITANRDEGEAVEAMLIRDGRIAEAGDLASCERAARDPERLDLQGATVVPGFIDAHCHPLMLGQFLSWTDCGWEAAPTIDNVVEGLRKAGRLQPKEAPIRGYGFNQGNVAEQRHLTRLDLDQVSGEKEVTVFHSSGHGLYANTWTLDDRGLGANTPDPNGGHFGRFDDGGLDGSLWDAASDHITGRDGVKTAGHGPNFHLSDGQDQLTSQLALAQSVFLSSGITTVVDAQVTGRELRSYFDLRRQGRLQLRVEMLMLSSMLDQLETLGIHGRLGDDRLAISGVKLYADGSLTAGTARFEKPYCCDPTDHGFLYHDEGEFAELLSRAHGLGVQAATHAQGDAAIDLVLRSAAEVLNSDPRLDTRHRIEHCGAPTSAQVERIGELEMYPISQPQNILRYGDELLTSIGEDRAGRIIPLGEYAAQRVPVVLSSDAPVAPPSPIEAIFAATARETISGRVLGPDDQKITVMQALRGHTLGAAESIHREGSIGSLEPGKLADFVVLDRDPRELEPSGVLEMSVVETWMSGAKVAEGPAGQPMA